MSFEEFVNAVANIQDEYADKHIRSQHTFIYNAQGELLIDYIGHLETFKDDFQYVARRIGLSVESLQHYAQDEAAPLQGLLQQRHVGYRCPTISERHRAFRV